MRIKLEFVLNANIRNESNKDKQASYIFTHNVQLTSEWEILHIPVRAGKIYTVYCSCHDVFARNPYERCL